MHLFLVYKHYFAHFLFQERSLNFNLECYPLIMGNTSNNSRYSLHIYLERGYGLWPELNGLQCVVGFCTLKDIYNLSLTCRALRESLVRVTRLDKNNYRTVRFNTAHGDDPVEIDEIITFLDKDFIFDFTIESRPSLSVIATEKKGYGLFANNAITLGSAVLRYCGQMVSSEFAERRYREIYDVLKWNYILTMKEVLPDSQILVTNIDATYRGGIARYINHSCDPNMIVVMDRCISRFCSSEAVGSGGLIAAPTFICCRPIAPGDELTFDYAFNSLLKDFVIADKDTNPAHKKRRILTQDTADDASKSTEHVIGNRFSPCYCGAEICRKWLLFGS